MNTGESRARRKNTYRPPPKLSTVTKAAAISTAMLARKSSFSKERESMVAGDHQDEEQKTDKTWFSQPIAQQAVKWACLVSMVSVSANTPYVIDQTKIGSLPFGLYLILAADSLITILFTIEAVVKMKQKGAWGRDRNSYFRDRWCQFDFFMLISHWAFLVVEAAQATARSLRYMYENEQTGILASEHRLQVLTLEKFYRHYLTRILISPRPLIMIRFIRSMVKFQLPRNRIQQIFKRSSQQVYNVTIFFLFFMSLYGILGVQFFGRMEHHCVMPGANTSAITINDLAIPDRLCDPYTSGGYQCHGVLTCKKLDLTAAQQGYYGMFNNLLHSVFTVYMAASQEGWVYVMYDCIDSLSPAKAFLYFTTLIFFLAWLVKNVFIAVITETFAEIRVQFSQIWAGREVVTEEEFRQIIQNTDEGWKLVTVDANKPQGWAPEVCQNIQRHTVFQFTMMIIVLFNAFVDASFVHYHDGLDDQKRKIYHYIEGYIRRGLHKYELVLCVGSTINVIPAIYETKAFTYFQVFRITRLIKASPMLEDFVYKIFGPGKKLGGLIVFTLTLLCITSSISVQLFCFVDNLDTFENFPKAFMAMFQILTQEGWTDIVVDVMRKTESQGGKPVTIFVAIYFVAYHLFVTLIVLSLFVAVILDNLEMDEELKKIKQLKAREQTTSSRTKLPLRLSIFTKFPDRPQMVVIKRFPGEFPLPKIRDSFTRTFADEEMEDEETERDSTGRLQKSLLHRGQLARKSERKKHKLRQIGQLTAKSGVTFVIEESNAARMLLSDSAGMIPAIGRLGTSKPKDRKKSQHQGRSMHTGNMYEHLRENGDLVRGQAESSARSKQEHGEMDYKQFQQKKQQAELTRNRLEDQIRENHPYFDRPLFAVGRESRFRKLCQKIVYAKYCPTKLDVTTGKQTQRKYKKLHELLATMTYLDWTMVIMTCVSCCSMLYESPWPQNPQTRDRQLIMFNWQLQVTEYVFVITMTVELILKILANGLFFTPKAVVRDVGGVMTVFIYTTSLIFLCWMPDHVQSNTGAQLLMIFRAMRPLRIYTLVPVVRRVVVELCKGFKEILLVTVLLLVLMFIFASFGVQIAGGALAKCNDYNITARENCTGAFSQKVYVTKMEVEGKNGPEHPKIMVPRVWANPRNFNFDNIGSAMLSLFEILSFKGWNVVRDIILKSSGHKGYWAAVFVHIYVFIGCMIGLTLFVGVVIANYGESRGTALLTVDQRRWKDLKNRLKMAQPLHVPKRPPEAAKFCNFAFDLSMSNQFKRFFTLLVVANSLLLCFPWSVQEENYQPKVVFTLTGGSAFITLLFVVEIVIKCLAFTVRGYWQSRRNRVDLFITVLGLLWCGLHFGAATLKESVLSATVLPFVNEPKKLMFSSIIFGNFSSLLIAKSLTPCLFIRGLSRLRSLVPMFSKYVSAVNGTVTNHTKQMKFLGFTYQMGFVVNVLRFFTIAGRHSTLKMLMLTVVMSMFRSSFIIISMFLLMLFYAYTGVILFGMVKYGQAVGRHANFRSAGGALTVLFRIVTGEDWNEIMHDCMRAPPYCSYKKFDAYWQTDCGNYYGAVVFFCSFYLIITYIVLNLLVAIIMENFSLFYSSEEDALLSYADIRNFQITWNIVDKEAKLQIPVRRVPFLLRLLKGRLEVDSNKDRLLFKHMVYEMERLHNSEDVSFHDVLSMLSYRSVDIRKSLLLEELLQREELEYIIEEEVAKQTIRSWLEKCLRRMRQKEQSTSIINSLRTTAQALLGNRETELADDKETHKPPDEKEERTRKRGKGSRRGSVSGMVAEAAKRFQFLGSSRSNSVEKPGADKSPALEAHRPKKPTLKAISVQPSHDLPEVDEQREDVLPTVLEATKTAEGQLSVLSSTPQAGQTTTGGLTTTGDIQGWWNDFESWSGQEEDYSDSDQE